ncbi:MAG: hypothetical protein ACRD9W_24370 [Terriglobia bacterium]
MALLQAGNIPGNCGVLPLTGEVVYLIPEGNVAPTTPCPPTAADAQFMPGSILGTITPPGATFANVPFPNATKSSTLNMKTQFYYEVCAYALGTSIIGDSGGWSVTASIGSGPDATSVNEVTPPGDRLLTQAYNGVISSINFTTGGQNFIAYLRIVNKLSTNAQVVCHVVGDDGSNGYSSLWTTGLGAGLNASYFVPDIFAAAGVGESPANPWNLGSLTCFHPQGVNINQYWLEPNGSIVNIQ